MNSEALRLLDELDRAVSFRGQGWNAKYCLAVEELRALLSAQEPTGWRPMSERPKDGQRIVYWFEPFNSVAIGVYHSGDGLKDMEGFDYVIGRNGFTTVDQEVPWL